MRTLDSILLVFLVLVVMIAFTVPIPDSDIFWHLSYAEQMLARGTPILDHTLYSWTPTSSAAIYCAWLSELALYGLWRLFGWQGLFALRYLLALLPVALLLHYAWRLRVRAGAPVLAIIAMAVLASAPVARNLKPEIISVAFTYLLLWLYFSAKRTDRAGEPSGRYWWSIPVLMLIWVNAHGGFLLIAPVMAALFAGEWLNHALKTTGAMTSRGLAQLSAAWMLSALIIVATPYGWQYPRQLLNEYLLDPTTPQAAYEWNTAHQSLTLGSVHDSLHLGEAFWLMATLLALVIWNARRSWRRIDVAWLLALLAATGLFFWYLRTTYVLPAVFAFAAIGMMADGEERRPLPVRTKWLAWPSAVVLLLLGVRALGDARQIGSRGDFFGLGFGYDVPVAEAEYIRQHTLPRDLYNTFDSGGYFIWRLYPEHRVMVDSRSFPYYGWFQAQYDFATGQSFESFQTQFQARAAVIDLEKRSTWRSFARSSEWKLLFYGPTAAVFVRRDEAGAADTLTHAASLSQLANGNVALRAFEFARFVGDYDTAWQLLDQLSGPLRSRIDGKTLLAIQGYRQAIAAAQSGDYRKAGLLMRSSLDGFVISDREQTMLTLIAALSADSTADRVADIQQGLQRLLSTRAPVTY